MVDDSQQVSDANMAESPINKLAASVGASKERRRDSVDPKRKARRYQLEVKDRALEENTIIFLETGCGKTLIAVLLIDALSHLIRKPSCKIGVFLAPNKALVDQQAKEIEDHTDLKVGKYWGSMEGDTWNYVWWREQILKHEVIVMTPQILFNNLHHCFFTMGMIELLIFDECHHAQKRHPYANIMRDFYHTERDSRPKVFGMTASPIIGKVDGGGVVQISQQMEKLERMLDAKVYTLKDRRELETLLPNPTENIRMYDPVHGSELVKRLCGSLDCLRHKFLNPVISGEPDSDSTKVTMDCPVNKKQRDEVDLVHRTLEYCIYELGQWCAQKAAQQLLEKDGVCSDAEASNVKQLFTQEALAILQSFQCQEFDNVATEDNHLLLSTKLLSPKLCCLLGVLLDYRENFQKCIIFVERVVATKVLASLFGHLPCLSFLRCLPLMGSQSMSQKSQQQTIEKFRSGEVNLLIATDIAEEGLDIKSCSMVIRFDAPKTNRSFIQSRGRARQLGSNYVVLVERGNQEQFDNVMELREKEKLMWELTANREDVPVLLKEPVIFEVEVEVYRVESTGAMVTTDYSIPLLYRYCSKLPGDQFYRPAPVFSFPVDTTEIVCEVRLPSTAPFQLVRGHACTTEKMARRVAALECCKKLHAKGVLTDYLLPTSEEPLENDEDPTKLSLQSDPMTELHATLVPTALQGQWGAALERVSLFSYGLHIVAEPQDRDYADFALFLEKELDSHVEGTTTELLLTKGRVAKVQLIPGGKVEFSVEQLRDAQLFQERVFKILLDGKTEQETPWHLSLPTQADWDPRRLYLVLPLMPGLLTSVAVDWKCIKDVLSQIVVSISEPVPDVEVQASCGKGPDLACLEATSTPFTQFAMANGSIPVNKVINSLVETAYNGRLYCVVDVLWHMDATSQFYCNPSHYRSYVDYFKKRWKLDLVHCKQPLLHAKQLMKIQNLIVKRPDKEPGSATKPEMLVELPPELCSVKVLGFPTRIVNTLSLIPSFMHRLEYILIAIQLQQKLEDAFQNAVNVSPKTVLQALTTATCLETFSLERLELFGDSFLKFAVSKQLFLVHENKHEGQLTKLRQSVICNLSLHKLGVARDLPLYIHDEYFQARDWAAPGRPFRNICNASNCATIHAWNDAVDPSKVNQVKCSEGHRWIQKKTVADVVEAFIGAYLVDGGPDCALAFMGWVGIEVHFDPSLVPEASVRCAGDVRFIQGIDLSKVETILGYTFQNKAVLVEALTHSSFQVPFGNCYQRLEFLGDAVLDFLITSHLYAAFPDLSPGHLTDLRSATACNERFARVAVRNKLQKYLLHNSAFLEEEVRKFVVYVESVDQGKKPFYGWECDKVPKVLGDLVESLAGAVLVDTGFNSNKVWEVFEPLLQPIVTPDTVHIHPVRELGELCSKKNFNLDWSHTQREKLSVVKVTVDMENNSIVTEAAKPDKKSAKRLAAYEALKELKNLGWEHPNRSLAKALFSQGKVEAGARIPETNSSMDGVQEVDSLGNDPSQILMGDQQTLPRQGLTFPTAAGMVMRKAEKGTLVSVGPGDQNYEMMKQSQNAYKHTFDGQEGKKWQGASVLDIISESLASTHCWEGNTDLNMGGPGKSRSLQLVDTPRIGDDVVSELLRGHHRDWFGEFHEKTMKEVTDFANVDEVGAQNMCQSDLNENPVINQFHEQTFLTPSPCQKPVDEELANSDACHVNHHKFQRSQDELHPNDFQDTRFDAGTGMQLQGDDTKHDSVQQTGTYPKYFTNLSRADGVDRTPHVMYEFGFKHEDSVQIPESAKNPTSSATDIRPPELPPKVKVLDDQVGRPREDLHNLCAKHKWSMPTYMPSKREGPPHAPRFTYVVRVAFKEDYEVECEGLPKKDTKRAMDSAASEFIAWLNQATFIRT